MYKKRSNRDINSTTLTGAPVKPIKGTFPSILCLVKVIASPTYFNLDTAPSSVRLSISDGSFMGSGKTGPWETLHHVSKSSHARSNNYSS